MRILIAGATGLVGQGVLQCALAAPDVTRVGALVRRETGIRHPALVEIIAPDFSDLVTLQPQLQSWDACLYCAGATPVGTPEQEYRHVTLELTREVARTLAALNPAVRFLYVSGAHANPRSWIMPLRIKGETEAALAALSIRTVMLRPGGIRPVMGEQSAHAPLRKLHAMGGALMGHGMRLLPSMFTDTRHLGRAMLALARHPNPPAVVENLDINHWGADESLDD